MQRMKQGNFEFSKDPQSNGLLFACLLMAGAIGLCGIFLFSEGYVDSSFAFPYLIPWILLTAAVITVPMAYQFFKGNFNLFDPITLASWTYFLPVFVFGGLIFAAGINQPFFVAFIDDPKTTLPLMYSYIILGVGGLIAGYYLPFGAKIGRYVSKKLPEMQWKPDKMIIPGILLIVIGFGFNVTSWFSGVIGFQRVIQFDAFDNVQYFLSLLLLEGAFLLWMYIFQTKEKNANFYLVLLILIAIIPLRTLIAGSRGSLYNMFTLIAMAYIFSGRKLKPKQSVLFGCALVAVIFLGMIYGTTFRNVKGNETRVSADEYVDSAFKTVDVISQQNAGDVLSEAVANLGERLENVSALAVIVSNYEKLAPYEAAYGMENNIWTYTWTAFIPRLVWNDKPIVSDARAYSELYFNFADNSFPMTTIGDLLRNFGPVGVPLGMMLLGFVLRIIYSSLIENQPVSIWRVMVYFMLITRISHEGFYGTILPEMIRALFIAVCSILLIKFIVRTR